MATLKGAIEGWRDEFHVEAPDDLRATVADADVSEQEVHERQRIAEDCEYAAHRLGLIRNALAKCDRLTARPPAPA